ncbi:AMP-binding protein [Saccharopolyspora sp. TS4A08]|uniref:AMP-binding protein n=1 Tax=Saccharopolyspora ipomoeae TaxID=3042027 RepID=A0ABT6PW00_9PSEU|nr:AMP-binding protein [Saccharopolyspora sp. TS4A08]MDI2031793.1 AMP-binding protein [Saccharopolyspora sp. TS4A08]
MLLQTLPGRRAAQDPHGPAIADESVDLTNAEFASAVALAAVALRSRGISSGDVVAIMMPNSTSFVVGLFAAWHVGAVVTPVNPSLAAGEVAHQLHDSAAKVVVTVPEHLAEIPNSVEAITDLAAHPGAAANAPEQELDSRDLALLIYTSGTTGSPKGVMLDHGNLGAMCTMMIEAFGLDSGSHSLLVLPLFHVNGIVVSILSPLLAGGRATIAGRFDPASFFDRVERARPTYFSGVPTIYAKLADLPSGVAPDTSSLEFAVCGAAPASVELLNKFERRFDVPIVEGYGLSEGTCASTVNPLRGIRKPGTVGLPLPGQSVRIVNADGEDLDSGGPGEVLIHGPNVMRGYLNRPEETAATVTDGWLRTGDIGYLDDDGYLTLVDRAKDMLIRGGENIYPKEIENVVYQLPEVFEAAVVGRPHPVLGEEPVLVVSPASGAILDEGEIRDSLVGMMSKFKLPAEIIIVDSLPKNPVGKIDKPSLRKRFAKSELI